MLNPISLFCCRRPEIEPQQELHINVQEDGDSPENSRNVPADSLDSSSLHSEDIRSTSQQSSRKEANILETRAFFLRYEPEIRFKRPMLKAGSEGISQSKKNHLLNA
ncbi:MAG: hypothetical protein JWQ00_434, partial [Noviherbaspirillum sp.]|nr:hypothetical protein [Noviherbaspirillum sp.]